MSKIPKSNATLQEHDSELMKRLLAATSNHHKHVEMYTHEQGQSVSLSSSGTFFVVTGNYTAGDTSGADFFTVSTGNGTITVGARGRGRYKAMYVVSFSANRNVTYHAAIFLNGTKVDKTSFRRDVVGTSFGVAMCFGQMDLEPGDVLDVRWSYDTGPAAVVSIDHANLDLFYTAGY